MTRRGFLKTIGRTAILSGLASQAACVHVAAKTRPSPEFGKRIMSADSKVLRSRTITVSGLPVPEAELPMHYLESTLPVPSGAPVVILVHGLALSGQYMVPTAEELAPFCKVYVPDFPGFGDSGKPSRVLDVPGIADSLAAWMEAMGLEEGTLLGNSFGCQIIGEFAVRYPQKTRRTVLQGPTTDPEERTWLMQFIRWRQNAKYNPARMSDVADIDYAKCGLVRALATFEFSLRHQLEQRLPLIEAPTRVVRGVEDPICRQDWAERVERLLPDGELVLIPGAHTLVFTHPEELVSAVRSFIV